MLWVALDQPTHQPTPSLQVICLYMREFRYRSIVDSTVVLSQFSPWLTRSLTLSSRQYLPGTQLNLTISGTRQILPYFAAKCVVEIEGEKSMQETRRRRQRKDEDGRRCDQISRIASLARSKHFAKSHQKVIL